MKRLLVTVLSMEAVVVLLAIVPAKQLGHVNVATAGAVCGAIALVAILLCGFVGRGRAGLYVGTEIWSTNEEAGARPDDVRRG